jgi:hypothetical protein
VAGVVAHAADLLLGSRVQGRLATPTRALAAGFDLVVPRSRMAREGAALVDRLVA